MCSITHVVKMEVSDLKNAGIEIPEFDDAGYRHLLLPCSETTWEDYGDMVVTWIECCYADTILLQEWTRVNCVNIIVEQL